jgi:hypothetical protein
MCLTAGVAPEREAATIGIPGVRAVDLVGRWPVMTDRFFLALAEARRQRMAWSGKER